MAAQAKAGDMAKGGGHHRGNKCPSGPPTLLQMGIDKNLAKAAQDSAPVDLPAWQLTATHVDHQLTGVLGKPTRAERRQADRATPRAAIAAAGDALVAQAHVGVVDDGLVAAP